MRKHKLCYCEIGFLKEFFASRPLFLEPTEENVQLMWVWVSLYKFICRASLVLDISKSDFEHLIGIQPYPNEEPYNSDDISTSDIDSNFRAWLKLINKSEGLIDFTESNDCFPYITDLKQFEVDEQKINALFLTTQNDDVCKKQSRLTGVFVLNNNLLKECAHLFMDNGHAIPCEGVSDWGFLKRFKYPSLNICNSIIIVDNYFFVDDKDSNGNIICEWPDKLKKNLLPILQSLMPEELDDRIIFEVTVFTAQERGCDWKGFENQYQYINTFLSEKKIKYRINFYGKCRETFHDRCILTNNVLISSGHGFGIFSKKDVSKPTTINITFPFVQSELLWCDGYFLNVLSQANKIINNRFPEKDNYWGDDDRNNRIVSHFIQKERSKMDNELYSTREITSLGNPKYRKRDNSGRIVL